MTQLTATMLREMLAEKSRPQLAKCRPLSRRERCEERAARAFRGALEVCRELGISQRAVADLLTRSSRERSDGKRERLIDHRQVADYMSGARDLPAWVPLALPARAQVAYLSELARDVDDNDSETDSEDETRVA